MNARQNALEIIRFGRPERIVCGLPSHGLGYLGVNHEGYVGGGHHLPVGSVWTDVWGTTWKRELDGVMGFPQAHPLADFPAALRIYAWPDPDDERICGPIYEQAKGHDPAEAFLVGSHRETLWEKSYMLVGMETLMVAFHAEPNAVRELLHRIMDFDLAIARHYAAAGADAAGMGDDLGTQLGLLLSPAIIRGFLVPEYRRLFEFYRQRQAVITFHSCGNITCLAELFIDLGVNVLNPVQATANDLDELRRVTQGRMALAGGVRSDVIVAGPIPAIRREVARRLLQLGRHGGYFCDADQGMPWPADHIQAVHAAVQELGAYPLDEQRLLAV
jgi:uroporphyrinogen decarboxylase